MTAGKFIQNSYITLAVFMLVATIAANALVLNRRDLAKDEHQQQRAQNLNGSLTIANNDEAVAQNLTYLSENPSISPMLWANNYTTSPFSSSGANAGQNYNTCSNETVAVGIQCYGKHCGFLQLVCASLNNGGINETFNTNSIPAIGDGQAIMNSALWFNDATTPNYGVCPANQAVGGVACIAKNCQSMSLFCMPSTDPNFITASPNPNNKTTDTNNYNQTCTWEATTETSGKALCPANKILSGFAGTGTDTSVLQVYCCPAYIKPIQWQLQQESVAIGSISSDPNSDSVNAIVNF